MPGAYDKYYLDYRASHQHAEKPIAYDKDFWLPGTTKHLFWKMEQEILRHVLNNMPESPSSALDFACGTGRVLSFLEQHVAVSVGIDVSWEMLKMARERCTRSRIIHGDVTHDSDLIQEKFDVITAFRFFLNAEQELRDAALASIRNMLTARGVLIANFHMNPRSLSGTYIRIMTRRRGTKRPMLSLQKAKQMLAVNGFDPVACWGYGYLLHRAKHPRFTELQTTLESSMLRLQIFPSLAQCFVLVARCSE